MYNLNTESNISLWDYKIGDRFKSRKGVIYILCVDGELRKLNYFNKVF